MSIAKQLDRSTRLWRGRRFPVHVVVAIAFLIVWGILLLGWTGNTLHTIDNVRDFRVASGIATGTEFPSASQPFAARLQLPPTFFYVAAAPLLIWNSEYAVFLATALCVLGSVAWLARVIQLRFGARTAAAYLCLALPPHGAVVFQGISNPALAFVAINVLLALVLLQRSLTPFLAAAIVTTAWIAPQMHPSAFYIALGLLLVSVVSSPNEWGRRSSLFVPLLLFCLSVYWVSRYGLLAPEADQQVSGFNPFGHFVERLMPTHWYAVWTTPWAHVRALAGITTPLKLLTIVLQFATLALACVGLVLLIRAQERALRLLGWVLLANFVAVTVSLSAWGFWYLDASWPTIAVCAAVAVGRIKLSRFVFALFAVAAMALPAAITAMTAKRGVYEIESSGTFFPSSRESLTLTMPTAHTILKLREFAASYLDCDPSRIVGIDEAYLRDMTLRTVYGESCNRWGRAISRRATEDHSTALHSRPSPSRYLLRRRDSPLPIPQRGEPILRVSAYDIYRLPAIDALVNGDPVGAVQSSQPGARYSYFSTLVLAPGSTISASVEAGNAMHAVFRCHGIDASALLQSIDTKSSVEVVSTLSLPPTSYMELRVVSRSPVRDHVQLTVRASIACDVSAWAM